MLRRPGEQATATRAAVFGIRSRAQAFLQFPGTLGAASLDWLGGSPGGGAWARARAAAGAGGLARASARDRSRTSDRPYTLFARGRGDAHPIYLQPDRRVTKRLRRPRLFTSLSDNQAHTHTNKVERKQLLETSHALNSYVPIPISNGAIAAPSWNKIVSLLPACGGATGALMFRGHARGTLLV